MRPHGIEPRSPGDLARALVFGEQVVIPRRLLHFERTERPPGPLDARMRAAFQLAGRTRAPFARPGLHLVWQARHVAVWSWDQDLLAAYGIPPDAWTIPEPELDGEAPGDGIRLLGRDFGYEAQYWREGALTASRFWPRHPSPEETEQFRRASEGSDQLSGPAAYVAAADPMGGLAGLVARVRPVHALLAVTLCVLTPLMYTFGAYIRLAAESDAAREKLTSFAAVSADDIDALEQFRSSGERLALYRDALEGLNPLRPATELAETAAAAGARIVQLRIEPGRLRARLETDPLLDPASLTRALEVQPSLINVGLSRPAQGTALDVEAELLQQDPGAGP